MPTDPPIIPDPHARYRYLFTTLGFLLFLISLFLPTANLNLFLRWRGNATGLQFLAWLFLGIPRQLLSTLRDPRGGGGYIPLMDLLWWIAAITAILLFLASPLLIRRTFTAPTLLTLRYLALVLLVFPATAFFPEPLRYPQPHIGLFLLAASHLAILIALWCPWPSLTTTANYFPITPNA